MLFIIKIKSLALLHFLIFVTLSFMITILDFERPIIDLERKMSELKDLSLQDKSDYSQEIKILENKIHKLTKEIYMNLSPWQKVQLARHKMRPIAGEYIDLVFSNFFDLNNYNLNLISGIGEINSQKYLVLAQNINPHILIKSEKISEIEVEINYNKFVKHLTLAEKWNLPVVFFLNNPEKINEVSIKYKINSESVCNLINSLTKTKCPTIAVVVGEAYNESAMIASVTDVILMQEYSVMSSVSPEYSAKAIWANENMAESSSSILKLTSNDLIKFKIIDSIIDEPSGGAHKNIDQASRFLKSAINVNLNKLKEYKEEELLNNRIKKIKR